MTVISRRVVGVFAAVGLALLAACNLSNLQAPGLAKDKEDAAKAVFTAFQRGDTSGLQMGPEMQTPEAQGAIPQIYAAIPKGTPSKIRLLNWKTNWSSLTGAREEVQVTNHEYTFPDVTLNVETVISRDIPAQGQPGPWKLRGFHFQPAGQPQVNTPPAKAETPAQATPSTGATNDFVEQPSDDGRSFAQDEASQDEIRRPERNTTTNN